MPKDQAYLEAEKKIAEALKSGATELDLSVQRFVAQDLPKLTELPDSLWQLTQLTKLNLSNNQLTILPNSLGQLTQLTELNLSNNQLTALPDSLGQLTQLTELDLSNNQLTTLPDSLGQLTQLTSLNLYSNQLTALPDSLGQFTQLTELNLSNNQLTTLPDSLGQLTQLTSLNLYSNQLTTLPDWLGQLIKLEILDLGDNHLEKLPELLRQFEFIKELNLQGNKLVILPDWLGQLTNIQKLFIANMDLVSIPDWIRKLTQLQQLDLFGNQIYSLPNWIGDLEELNILYLQRNKLTDLPTSITKLKNLKGLYANDNQLTSLPSSFGELRSLEGLHLNRNKLTDLPSSFAQLVSLKNPILSGNPFNPALQSAYEQGLDAVKAYLRSLEQNAEPLYEAKLVLVGEGNVGKTTLLKALKGKAGEPPQKNEATTHGVEIDIHGLRLPHPQKDGVEIQLNAWDFGGQDVYRVTHQFFFSRRSLYLLVWEPRNNVQQGRLDEWLDMIRLRVGDEARVIIVSTHCKEGGHLARIDKSSFKQKYGEMIVDFQEVDSLVPDKKTGEMVGIAKLKKIIARESAKLGQMGMLFNNNWKAARDELIKRREPRISYQKFIDVCAKHGLSDIDTETLAHLMHDLGHIVHYSEDEKLRDDVVLKPEWLMKAIGFVLEDRTTQEKDGILDDSRLFKVWHDHRFKGEPRYKPELYPFFLRLMEKYDVSYRLTDGKTSLVAQHVPQIRPDLPWSPEQNTPEGLRRIAMICSMDEDPPGLVPWMIVRTHDYTTEQIKNGKTHRLHWDKGMFLTHMPHGEAMLEKREREFHVYIQAVYPEYFMNVLQETLQKLIKDNWPGLEGRYRFAVPCPTRIGEKTCKGRFSIQALRQFMANGVREYHCQECFKSYPITKLLLGFEELAVDVQLREIKEKLAGMDSRIAHYFMATMNAIADEAKSGPRLFTFRSRDAGLSPKQIFTRPISLQLWCEAEGCQHPIIDNGKGLYSIDQPHDWVMKIAPYANFALDILKTVAPIAGPAINTFFGAKTTELWGIADHLSLAGAFLSKVPDEIKTPDKPMLQRGMVSEPERSGILALHRLLNELDPNQEKLGLHRVATYTGDFRWLCKRHYDAYQPNIPDVIK